jgi:hypothetical protein
LSARKLHDSYKGTSLLQTWQTVCFKIQNNINIPLTIHQYGPHGPKYTTMQLLQVVSNELIFSFVCIGLVGQFQ